MPTKLYIGNISPSVSSTELKELFEKYGKVLECDIVKDYAFVVSTVNEYVRFRWETMIFLLLSSIWKMEVKQKLRSLH
jgi:RNA recognition motif-containing protein